MCLPAAILYSEIIFYKREIQSFRLNQNRLEASSLISVFTDLPSFRDFVYIRLWNKDPCPRGPGNIFSPQFHHCSRTSVLNNYSSSVSNERAARAPRNKIQFCTVKGRGFGNGDYENRIVSPTTCVRVPGRISRTDSRNPFRYTSYPSSVELLMAWENVSRLRLL